MDILRKQLLDSMESFTTQAKEKSDDVLTKDRDVSDWRKEKREFLASQNSKPQVLTNKANEIEAGLREQWRTTGGTPTTAPLIKLAVEVAVAANAGYQRLVSECNDAQYEMERREAVKAESQRAYNGTMCAWWMNVFGLAPTLDLGSLGVKIE